MKIQFSAGGIIVHENKVLLCQHSQHHGWVFPKGLMGDHIEGEGKEETALREVKEETGAIGKIVKALTPVTYWFVLKEDPSAGSGQVKIRKTVYYFLMDFAGGDITKHDHEMEDVEWVPINEVEKRLTYKSDKQVWQVALRILD
ncbi:MAG: NUDIX domain-containing protein [Candidatus Levybacteria bacterium]|nr:NUDIX domain-containing protein [Candidatus Levybacteria bacterium]